jgi:glycosyltransferase involved in cell wall biosynthesis
LLACTDAISVLSREEERALTSAGYTKPIPVVKNGLDLSRYAARCDIRPRLGLPADAIVLLFIARLIPAKGLGDAVQAMSSVSSKTAHLVVVGDGPSRTAAEQRVGALGLQSRVHFVGSISEDQAKDYYCGSDILVFPTHHNEGFPMSIFQAVASGMCIVTTRIRAAADHLDDPTNCLFVPPRDPRALAEALQRLLNEPALRRHMGQNNRQLAKRFDRRLVADEFAEIYRSIAPVRG